MVPAEEGGRGSEERGLVIYDPENQARTISDRYVTLFELAEMRTGEFRTLHADGDSSYLADDSAVIMADVDTVPS